MNAIDRQIARLLGEALECANHDGEIRAVVVTGSGSRAFCSGGDLNVAVRGERILAEGHEEWGFGGYVRHFIDKPTIAAVNGIAIGGGFEIVLASDLAVAARSATFALPDVLHGRVAGAGGAIRLPAQLPRKVAMKMLLTGEPMAAEEACRLGLVNEVVDDEQVVVAALDLAEKTWRAVPYAVSATKRIAHGVSGDRVLLEEQLWELNSAEIAKVRASKDWNEGYRAFLEHRGRDEE